MTLSSYENEEEYNTTLTKYKEEGFSINQVYTKRPHIFSSNLKNITMTNIKKEVLANILQNSINETDKWFKTKEYSDAHIIGYLQGTIKHLIKELKSQAYRKGPHIFTSNLKIYNHEKNI